MNPDQIKSLVRSLVGTFGGMIAGWFAAKGWFTVDQVLSVLNSPTVIGIVSSVVMAAWGLFTHTTVNTVAAANALPQVAGVITMPTVEGRALAEAIPDKSVAVAGSVDAATVAGP